MVSVSGVEGKKISVGAGAHGAEELDPTAARVGAVHGGFEPHAVEAAVELAGEGGVEVENGFRTTRPGGNDGVAGHR
jgi:hypothetical protein